MKQLREPTARIRYKNRAAAAIHLLAYYSALSVIVLVAAASLAVSVGANSIVH